MKRIAHSQIELQIAPMIDVCFLLLFFYILTSKPVKPEADMSMSLPGTVPQEESIDIPDEQRIIIQEDGQVIVCARAGIQGVTFAASEEEQQ